MIRVLGPRLAGCGAIFALLAWQPAWGQTAADVCMTCHSDRTLARTDSRRGTSLFVDAAEFGRSAHAGIGCVGCHPDAESVPHESRLSRVRCASCHAAVRDTLSRSVHGAVRIGKQAIGCQDCHGAHDVQPAEAMGPGTCAQCHAQESADFRNSVHGLAITNGDSEAATCRNCHGSSHEILSHRDEASPTHHARLARTCAQCHADRELVVRRKITIPQAYALYERSVHGQSSKAGAATCSDCHESHRLRRATDPASSIYRTNVPRTCGRCHAQEEQAYETGIHGTALRRGVVKSPVCTDCHGEHLIRGPHDPGSPVDPAAVTVTCARCHEAEGIRETYGLPAGRLSTYRDSYHGLAARGGSPVVAHCASCHGYHDILPSTDPRSEVSPERLPQTCGKCHPGAGAKFAAGPVHVAMATPANPVLYYVRWIYLLLIGVTISGMAFHQGLHFVSRLRVHFKKQGAWDPPERAAQEARSGGRLEGHATAANAAREADDAHSTAGDDARRRWFLRLTLSERWQHALLAVSFLVLVYTGFALKFPESWPFAWLARLEHGYAWRSLVHRWAGGVMVAVSLFHVAYLFTRRGRGLLADMAPRVKDTRDVVANVLHMAGLKDSPPAFERFGYIEKAEYWALIWGTVVMTVTGLVLWFENQSLQWLDKWMLDVATLVHYYEAWLAFLAILVWHIYQNVLNPDVYPMNWTWLTGRISEEQLRHEHGAEWARIVAAEREEAARLARERAAKAPAETGAGEAPVEREGSASEPAAVRTEPARSPGGTRPPESEPA